MGDAADDLRDLWLALHRYHGEIGSRPLVADEAFSWRQRRAVYERWLDAGKALLLLMEREGKPIGYVLAHLQDGPDDASPSGIETPRSTRCRWRRSTAARDRRAAHGRDRGAAG